MENQFEKGPAAPKSPLEEIKIFGDFLYKARNNPITYKNKVKMAAELNVSRDTLTKYENGEFFPKEESLPLVAQAYGLDLDEVKAKFEISRGAQARFTEARKGHKKPPRLKDNWGLTEGDASKYRP